MQPKSPPLLNANFFDGVSARAIPVTLSITSGQLHLSGDGVQRWVASNDIQWPERTRHSARIAHFRSGGMVHCSNLAEWDAWRRASGQRESLVVTLQQSWRWVVTSVLVLMAVVAALYQWGLPVAARAVVALVPFSWDVSVGESTLAVLDEHLMDPSELPVTEQARFEAGFREVLKASSPGSVPTWRLVFRKSRIGANAFALPGGTLVLTDEMVELVNRDSQVVSAVLAHEMGHLQQRHGMRLLVQSGVLGVFSSVLLGDFSTLLAGVPVWIGQASYSRDAERAADAAAVQILQSARLSPRLMVTLFERLNEQRKSEQAHTTTPNKPAHWLGLGFASHPTDAERIRFFESAAR
jgi:Zn-dependent protease with chaperone function